MRVTLSHFKSSVVIRGHSNNPLSSAVMPSRPESLLVILRQPSHP